MCLLVLPQCNGSVVCPTKALCSHHHRHLHHQAHGCVHLQPPLLSITMHTPSCIMQRSATHAWARYYVCTVGSVRGAGQKKSRMEPCLRWRLRLPG